MVNLRVIAEHNKRPTEALAYDGLVQSWSEIARLANSPEATTPAQGEMAA
jgi:putative DNA methylase